MRILFLSVVLLSISSCAKNSASSATSLADGVSTTDCAAMLQGLAAAGAKLVNIERLDANQLEVTWTLQSTDGQSAMCATDLQGKWAQALSAGWPSGH